MQHACYFTSGVTRRVKSRMPLLWVIFILAFAFFLLPLFPSSLLHILHSRKSAESTTFGRSTCFMRKDSSECNFAEGSWVFEERREPLYGQDCPFHRNAWNCGNNRRPGLVDIYRWNWVPQHCILPAMDPGRFLSSIQNMNLGFVGDSLNENLLVSLLCILATADPGARRWKRRKAWRGAYFPKYNVTVGYHRAVLLADYHDWKARIPSGPLEKLGYQRGYQVNVDLPASDWINVAEFYHVVVFNTGHWWGSDKFPPDNPLLFHKDGEPIIPPLDLRDGMKVVLQNMVSFIEKKFPPRVLKIWRTQSPRHFEGGEWNQNGSCISDGLLMDSQVEQWFGLGRGGINREARELNAIIVHALEGASFRLLNVTYLSEFRKDAHPAIWLGQKNAHITWGQDCMHWCLPGLPDTWNNILMAMVVDHLTVSQSC